MSQPSISQRGRDWFHALCGSAPLQQGLPPSLLVADSELAGQPARYIAVVADPHNPFERARHGEVGLLEGWALAAAIDAAVQADQQQTDKRAIVAIIDVPSQATRTSPRQPSTQPMPAPGWPATR